MNSEYHFDFGKKKKMFRNPLRFSVLQLGHKIVWISPNCFFFFFDDDLSVYFIGLLVTNEGRSSNDYLI